MYQNTKKLRIKCYIILFLVTILISSLSVNVFAENIEKQGINTLASSPALNLKKYDSRSSDTKLNRFGKNIITPIKKQYRTNTCWAFSNLSVVETLLKIKYDKDFDLSEGHMAYNIDINNNLQSGGNGIAFLAYSSRLSGPVLEEKYPAYTIDENNPADFSKKEFDSERANLLPPEDKDTFKIAGDVFNKKLNVFIPNTLEFDVTLENLKKCVFEYGSVSGSYYVKNDGFSKDVLGNSWRDKISVAENGIRYHYVLTKPRGDGSNVLYFNHEVAIIGWNDDVVITNNLGETAKGAFLVKNSVSSPVANDNLDYWISYESFLGKEGTYISNIIIIPKDVRLMSEDERRELINVYNPANLASRGVIDSRVNGNLNKGINVYKRNITTPETIKYVTYYNRSEKSAKYSIYITEDKDLLKENEITLANGKKKKTLSDRTSDNWTLLSSGTFEQKGYNTLDVITPYTITDSEFALKIEIESNELGFSYRTWPTDEEMPILSYKYNDGQGEHYFEELNKNFKVFLGVTTVTAKEYTVEVTDAGNGTAIATPEKGNKGTQVSLTAEANSGYEFDKWEVTGATAVDKNSATTTLTIGEGNVTAKAIFKEKSPVEYKVSFVTLYGTKPADINAKEGEKVKAPEGYIKDTTEFIDSTNGKVFVFKGWYDDSEEYNFDEPIKGDKILTAKYEEKINTLLNEAKDAAKKEIKDLNLTDDEKKAADEAIDNAKTKDEVDKAVEEAKEKSAANDKKAKAEALEKAKVEAKKNIDALNNLTQGEKDNFNNRVDQASTKEGVAVVLDEAKKISDERKTEAEKLQDEKNKLKEKLDTQVEGKDVFTPEKKEELKGKIDGATTLDALKPIEKEIDDAIALKKQVVPTPQPTPTPAPQIDFNRFYFTQSYQKPTEVKKTSKYTVDTIIKIGSNKITRVVNGVPVEIEMDVVSFIDNDRTYIPLRFVGESMGFEVTWDEANRTAILRSKDKEVKIAVDSNVFYVNGERFESDVKPMIKNSRTMIPVGNFARAIGLQDGKDIFWDGVSREVKIKQVIEY